MTSSLARTAAFVGGTTRSSPLLTHVSSRALPYAATTSNALHLTKSALSAAGPMQDYTSAAIAYFGGVRTPATLIAGSSLAALFTLVKLSKSPGDDKTQLEVNLARTYHGLAFASFCLSLNVVVFSTVSSTLLLLGKHNGMATSAYAFLKREFEYEFVMTRFCFLSSLVCFISAVATRFVLEFDMAKPDRRKLGLSVGAIFGAFLLQLVSYVNCSVVCWPNLFLMGLYTCKLILKRALAKKFFLHCLSVLSFASGIACAVRSLLTNNNKDEKVAQDEAS